MIYFYSESVWKTWLILWKIHLDRKRYPTDLDKKLIILQQLHPFQVLNAIILYRLDFVPRISWPNKAIRIPYSWLPNIGMKSLMVDEWGIFEKSNIRRKKQWVIKYGFGQSQGLFLCQVLGWVQPFFLFLSLNVDSLDFNWVINQDQVQGFK